MRVFVSIVALFSLPVFLSAQEMDYTRYVIDSLCSPSLYGRAYVEDGHHKVANFLEEEFRLAGLESWEGSYFQEFPLSVNNLAGKLTVRINGHSLIPGKDFLVDGDSPGIEGTFPLRRVKKSEALDRDKRSELLLNNPSRFLVIDEADFDLSVKEEKEFLEEFPKVLKFLEGLHVAGVIFITDNKLTWSPAFFQGYTPILRISRYAFPENAKSVDLDIEASFRENVISKNVIAWVPGSEQADSFIVFTGHYDHLGTMGREVSFPGANDNASGIAMMLNLARHYAKPENRPKQSIVFIAFSGEEIGLFGSRYYTEQALFPLENIRFLVNFDILGTGDEGIMVVNGNTFKKELNILKRVNEAGNLLPEIKTRGKMCKSDHCFFFEKGVPCFYLYTLGGIDAYHDIYDRPETLPLTEFQDLFKLITGFVEGISE